MLPTFPNPTIEAVMPDTVPVKVGDANGAFRASEAITEAVVLFSPVTCACNAVACDCVAKKLAEVLATLNNERLVTVGSTIPLI